MLFAPKPENLEIDKAHSQESQAKREVLSLIIRAILVNSLNPEPTIFFLAFLPQFISPQNSSPMAQMFLLSAMLMVMSFVVFIAYGLLANLFRDKMISSPHTQAWLRRSFTAAFASLGLKLALTER